MMTEQDKKAMTTIIRAQLEEQHGKPVSGFTIIVTSVMAMSIAFNGILGYTVYSYRELLHACWELLP